MLCRTPAAITVAGLVFWPSTTPAHDLQVQALVNDVREALCKVPDAMFDEVASSNVPTTTYEVSW
jgi:hypothetical protein